MDHKKEKIVTVVALIALVLVTVGISYAAFNYIGQGRRENTITTGNLTFVYDESNKEGNGISIENATPTSDELGSVSRAQGEVFEFSVTASTKGAPIYYEIYVTKQDSSTLPEKVVKTYLTSVQGEEETGVPNTLTNEAINTYNKLGISQVPDQEGGRTLYQETIPAGLGSYTKTFRYRMWISDTATEVDENGEWVYNNKSFTVRVNVYASNEEIGMPTEPPLPVMKTWSSISTDDFHANEYKTKITSVQFASKIDIPEGATNWDVSEKENSNGVMAWIVDDGTGNGTYALTIAGDEGVEAVDLSCFLKDFTALKSVDFTNLNTSKVTSMYSMFYGCSSLTSLNFDNFFTSNVENMAVMFRDCKSLTNLNLSSFDTSKVTNMASMFYGCSKLANLNLSTFDTSKVTNMTSMFANCVDLISLDLSNFNTSNVTTMSYMFSSCNKVTSLDLSNFDTSSVINMEHMFQRCGNLTSLDLSTFDTSSVTNMKYMFSYCSKLTSLNLDGFDTSSVTNMSSMFNTCSSLTSLNLSGLDTSKVIDMSYMFQSCKKLANLNLKGLDTSNVTNMKAMFDNCNSLTGLDLSSFNTAKVTDMSCMFRSCSSLTNLNLSSFDTSNVVDMWQMFSICLELTRVDFRNANFSKVVDSGGMFDSCPSTITVLVKDVTAQTFIRNRLGTNNGTVTIA